MPPVGSYVVIGAVAALVSFAACFPARGVARRLGHVAAPDERRVHQRPTPYGGGVAMLLAVFAGLAVASTMAPMGRIFTGSSEPLGVVIAAAVIFGVGLVDDARDMSAPAKVAGEVLAASVLYFFGVTMFQFKIPLAGFVVLSPGLTPLLTALWVIGITNAVNLIDGLDGLAAGIVAIGSGALAVYGLRLVVLGELSAHNIGPLIAVVTCGACLGFLPHNFHEAKVFMGDAGALLLGLLMASATMVVGGRTPPVSGQTYFFFAPLFIPLFILGVPIADMAFAFVRRTAKGTGFQTPDKDHIHHRLLRLGHGHRRTVVILWAWTVVLSGFVLLPLFGGRAANAVIPFGAVVLGLALYTMFHPGLRRGDDERAPEVVSPPADLRDDAPPEPAPPGSAPPGSAAPGSAAPGSAHPGSALVVPESVPPGQAPDRPLEGHAAQRRFGSGRHLMRR